MCEHLAKLDNEIREHGIKETFRGQPWSNNTREWVYYDCVLDLDSIRLRLNLPEFVTTHTNNDQKSGTEAGFYCELCQDGVMGHHPSYASGKVHFR